MKIPAAIAFLTPVAFGIIWGLWTLCIKLNYPGVLTYERASFAFFLACGTLGGAAAAFAHIYGKR